MPTFPPGHPTPASTMPTYDAANPFDSPGAHQEQGQQHGGDYLTYGGNSHSNAPAQDYSYAPVDHPMSAPDHSRAITGVPGLKRNGIAAAGLSRKAKLAIAGALALVAVIAIAVTVPLTTRDKDNEEAAITNSQGAFANDPSDSTSGSASNPAPQPSNKTPLDKSFAGSSSANPEDIQASDLTGGNGTTIIMENGQSFVYLNDFGGTWASTPFDDSARPNSWSPALNEKWDYATNKILGVNIGGWLVTEPFISPALYEEFENDPDHAVDENTLMLKWGDKAAENLRNHYQTFITEEDFALIAGAGFTWIRLPIAHWAIETVEGEPYLEGVSWEYILKAFTWARKYGLRVNLDLHTAPGSQNGWNHSGRGPKVGFLQGTMGIVNAQRMLNYIRTLAEFISQPQYRNVVPILSVINEPNFDVVSNETGRAFYLQAYNTVRLASGTGEGNGPYVAVDRAFQRIGDWPGFLSGADRLALDGHTYFAFDPPTARDTAEYVAIPCQYWSRLYNTSMQNFGLTVSGEWSLAVNDCGGYLNGVGQGSRYDGTFIVNGDPQFERVGSCDSWNDPTTWSDELKADFHRIAYAHMDALQNSFFWTWKIGESSKTPGRSPSPQWHLKQALQMGYFPKDPRPYRGTCASIVGGTPTVPFNGFPSPWMTGGAGAGTIAQDQLDSYGQWPPTSLAGTIGTQATNLPTYTPTGTIITLAPSTPAAYPTAATNTQGPGTGWNNAEDTAGWNVPKQGCTYGGPYDGDTMPVPNAPC